MADSVIFRGLRTSVRADAPYDANLSGTTDAANRKEVSDFVTVQSLSNFSVTSAAFLGIWTGLQRAYPPLASQLVPAALCLLFTIASIAVSKPKGSEWASVLPIALINGLILYVAVIGAGTADLNPTSTGLTTAG